MTLTEKHTILVVDDKPSNIEIIIQSFLEENYNMLAATNGETACILAENSMPDLIILDWHMPGMTGLDVIKKLKSKEETKDIIIIMATAVHTSSENLKEALEAGAYDFLRKPFDKIELEARVKSALKFMMSQRLVQQQQKELFTQKEEKLKESLESQKRELVSGALQILRQNEINLKLMDELSELLPDTSNETNSAIRSLINKYNIYAADNNWNEFQKRFEHIHVGFYDKLRKHYPDLTPNDTKICAFMRMGMSLSEISTITLQNTESIRKAKFRLRKKLNFDDDTELKVFLADL